MMGHRLSLPLINNNGRERKTAICTRKRQHEHWVVQRILYILDHCEPPLSTQRANSWNPNDCSTNITVKDDGMTLHRQPVAQSTDCARGKRGYTQGFHVWQIGWAINQRGTHASIGVATRDAPLHGAGYSSMIGSNEHSWGWDIGKNQLYHSYDPNGSSVVLYPRWLKPDESYILPETVYMALDLDNGTLSYYADDFLGIAFSDLPRGKRLYPIVSCVWGHCEVSLKYMGSMSAQPLPLVDICRQQIRDLLGRDHISEKVALLDIPFMLKMFLTDQKRLRALTYDQMDVDEDDQRNHNDRAYQAGQPMLDVEEVDQAPAANVEAHDEQPHDAQLQDAVEREAQVEVRPAPPDGNDWLLRNDAAPFIDDERHDNIAAASFQSDRLPTSTPIRGTDHAHPMTHMSPAQPFSGAADDRLAFSLPVISHEVDAAGGMVSERACSAAAMRTSVARACLRPFAPSALSGRTLSVIDTNVLEVQRDTHCHLPPTEPCAPSQLSSSSVWLG